MAFTNRGESTSLHIWNERMKAADAQAAELLAELDKEKTGNLSDRGNNDIETLKKFYSVHTDAELILAQNRHIEKLQAKLPPNSSAAPLRPRG